MGSCTPGELLLLGTRDENGDDWAGGSDFGRVGCAQPRTLEFIIFNGTGRKVQIDGQDTNTPTPIPVVHDGALNPSDVFKITGYTVGIIDASDTYSVFVTVDPNTLDNLICQDFMPGDFSLSVHHAYTDFPGTECDQDFSELAVQLKDKKNPTIDLGTQGNNDGYLQETTTIGTPITKTVTILNNDCEARDYTIAQPGFITGRFTTAPDLFTPFTLAPGDSQAFDITYDPTVEEIDCGLVEIEDDCGAIYSFTICYEAVPADAGGGGGGGGGGGTGGGGGAGGFPPCDSVLDCDTNNIPLEQLIRSAIIEGDDGCPAIKIILT